VPDEPAPPVVVTGSPFLSVVSLAHPAITAAQRIVLVATLIMLPSIFVLSGAGWPIKTRALEYAAAQRAGIIHELKRNHAFSWIEL
jgi:hypothetical protein